MDAIGMRVPVLMLFAKGIFPASNGRERMGAPWVRILVLLQLEVAISPAFNG